MYTLISLTAISLTAILGIFLLLKKEKRNQKVPSGKTTRSKEEIIQEADAALNYGEKMMAKHNLFHRKVNNLKNSRSKN